MHFSRPGISCLLYSCLWIAISFASSDDGSDNGAGNGDEKKIKIPGALTERKTWTAYEAGLMEIFRHLSLLPTALDWLVLDYVTVLEKEFLLQPQLKTEIERGPHCALTKRGCLVLGGLLGPDGAPYAVEPFPLHGIEAKLLPRITRDIKVRALEAYPGMNVFVDTAGTITMQLTNRAMDDVLTLSGEIEGDCLLVMAPSMTRNGLVWIHSRNRVLILNVGRMVKTGSSKVLWHRLPDSSYRVSGTCFNSAGTVLALNDHLGMQIHQVQLGDDGEIRLDHRLTVTVNPMDLTMLLEGNILATKVFGQNYFAFYRLNVGEEKAAIVREDQTFDAKCFDKFSYHADYDIVVGMIRKEEREKYADLLEPRRFFGDTKFMILDRHGTEGGKFESVSMLSPNLDYLLVHKMHRCTPLDPNYASSINYPLKTWVYQVTKYPEQS